MKVGITCGTKKVYKYGDVIKKHPMIAKWADGADGAADIEFADVAALLEFAAEIGKGIRVSKIRVIPGIVERIPEYDRYILNIED